MADEKPKPSSWKQFCVGKSTRWRIPFLLFEWICEHISYHLSRWAFIEVLEYIGKLSLLGAVILFIWDIPKRRQADEDTRKAKNYVAWQTLNSAIGKPGNSGRADASQDLNREGVSLAGIDLSGGVIFSKPLLLPNADLAWARFIDAFFDKPDFSHAKFDSARLEKTRIVYGNFSGANLHSILLTDARFDGCDFSSATISPHECTDVEFTHCDFDGAEIYLGTESTSLNQFESSTHKASFARTVFRNCNFTNCLLNIPFEQWDPNMFVGCHFFGVKNGYGDIQSFATKDRKNVSVSNLKFSEWLDWLDQNRQTLSGYRPEYPFYKVDSERVRRHWPSRK
jgi:uncharacterized protein YjbI with pentapeptide repeats